MTEALIKEPNRSVVIDQGEKIDCRFNPRIKFIHGPDINSSVFIQKMGEQRTIEIKPGEIKDVEIDGKLVIITHKPLSRYAI